MKELVSIIIADDEPLTRDAIYSILINHFEERCNLIIPVSNGVEALEKLDQFPCDILLTDVFMPEMNGIELLEKVDSQYPNIVKIVFSGYDEFQYARSSIRYHVLEYLLKPVDEAELINSIERAIEEAGKIKEKNKNAGIIGMHFSGKFSFLYTSTIIKDLIVAIKTKNESSTKSIIENLTTYLDEENNNIEEKIEMAEWFVNMLFSSFPKVLEENIDSNWDKTLKECKNSMEIKKVLIEMFIKLSNTLNYENISQQKLNHIKEYISSHYNEEIYLQKLADIFNINPTYICDLFKNVSGQTYADYLQEVRINRAVTLLENSDYKISQIAEATGYSDANYFAKAFKKIIGMTPNEFRMKMTKN